MDLLYRYSFYFARLAATASLRKKNVAPLYVRKHAVEEARIQTFALRAFNADMLSSASIAPYPFFPGLPRDDYYPY
jgi:hypothetical protein